MGKCNSISVAGDISELQGAVSPGVGRSWTKGREKLGVQSNSPSTAGGQKTLATCSSIRGHRSPQNAYLAQKMVFLV